ncbi:TonB-dependent receptor plug domain-containing protein [Janthinobacterium sp. B9-8]|uniref:TonB-dependent receptor plug domain-containing protein n=1 Tax=Janthinobacterium sp. B9-8 TaxID=1236179 RepID=UPI001E630296|nr:TonB-dependent receptor [Janthinobacterium sp. B9-8]
MSYSSLVTQPPYHIKKTALLLLLTSSFAMADVTLDTVVVTATRSERRVDDTPVRTEVISRAEIEKTHARTLKDAIENIPGLQLREVHGKSGYELSLQGLSSDQVLVLIDGLPIAASTSSTVNLSQYLLSEVDHIEVIKGAASAQYGSSAMGGVINVITRRVKPGFSGSADASLGSYGAQNDSGKFWDAGLKHGQFQLEGGSEHWRARLSGDVLDDAGFGAKPENWSRQGDASKRQQYGAKLSWLPQAGDELWVEGSHYREDDVQRYQRYVPPRLLAQEKTEGIARDRFVAGAKTSFANGMRVQAQLLDEVYDSEGKEYSLGDLMSVRRFEQHLNHLTAQVDLPAWYSQLWQFGVDWRKENVSQSVNGVSEFLGSKKVSKESRELFVQNDIFFGDDWEVVLGLRVQDDSDFGMHAAPKIALRGNVWESGDWKGVLRGSFGQGYRVPNLKERHFLFDHSSLGYMVLGNPNLKPESSNSWQLGGNLALSRKVSLDINAYFNQVKDLIQVDEINAVTSNGVSKFTYKNIARTETRGIETALDWRVSDQLNINTSYTYSLSKDLDSGKALTRRPENMARFGLDWEVLAGSTFTLRSRYQSAELIDSAKNAHSDAWMTTDIKFNQKINKNITAYIGIDNVQDTQRDFSNPNDFGPISGRFIYMGSRFAWGS